MPKRKPARCPFCGAARVVPVAYGMPSRDLLEQAEAGELVLGGCCLDAESPRWACLECQAQWGRLGDVVELPPSPARP